ncbi:hypothetical protein JHK86_035035 [Glycine max]|nr:hypothetical protein JHK86_035035 [Glycine max]
MDKVINWHLEVGIGIGGFIEKQFLSTFFILIWYTVANGTAHTCISRRNVHLNKKAMSQKENLISELHPRKGTWKIAMRITNMWDVKKHNGRQVIDMVLIDQTGVKIGATLWQELFPEFQPKLALGCSYLIQNIKVVDNQSEYKVSPIPYLLYFVKTTSVKEVERLEIPANVHKKGDKFSHNAQMVSLGDISRLREGGDEIKVFPECVDDLVGKTLALRDEQTIGKSPASCAETSSGDYHPTPSLSQSADYDHGNTAFITPAKRLSGQQATNEFDSEDTTASGRHLIWTMSMDNGVRCLAAPWYRFLMDNNVMAGDEVAFYFRPNQHVCELILRKQLIWDDEGLPH